MRNLWTLLALSLLAVATPSRQLAGQEKAANAGNDLHVNAQRLQQSLERLSEFGRNPEGGVTRLAFSSEEMAAREYVMGLMRAAGLAVRVDPVGNIFARREGTENLPAILFGSHIDSVPHGGNFDGDVGSLSAIEVLRALAERGVKTRHPLEAVIWTNEEGHHFGIGLFGSGAAAGLIDPKMLERRDEEGQSLTDWLRRYGQDPAQFSEAKIRPGTVAGYVELHIEQGAVLDEARILIGVVQGIVGIRRWTCVATGFANHAGTTPMNRRQDALAAAARAVLAVREEVRAEPGPQVGTVGQMKVEPGARNIIPGRVEFSVELRDLDSAKVARIWGRIESHFAAIAREENVAISCTPLSADEPAFTDPAFRVAIHDAAQSAGLATLDMPSGAGHDAQNVARYAPIGMIFVPSRGGISHSPREFTSWKDVANGAEILYRTVLLLDERLNKN
jgi:N-carbamoyl-L-amino-acid hydrolase